MENNSIKDSFHWIYKIGFSIILALPILTWPPYFFPPDFNKTIIFRSILAILLFLFIWGILNKKIKINTSVIGKNQVIYLMILFFALYLLASTFSVDPYFSFWGSPYRGGGSVTFTFYFVFVLLLLFILKDNDWKKLWDLSIITGILTSVVAIIQYYGLFSKTFVPFLERPPSTIGNPIILATYIILLLFPTISFAIVEPFNSTRNKIKKIFYIASAVLFFYIILITVSRAAFLGIIFGSIFFLLFYPQKMRVLKAGLVIFIAIVVGLVFYINTQNIFPDFLGKNRLFGDIAPRLSINAFLQDERFPTWALSIKALKQKFFLGYGPENFSAAFDENFDPKLGIMWWDKPHNALLQIASDAGVIALLVYLIFFVAIFWKMQKKKSELDKNTKIFLTSLQATLIAYFIANLFSFDCFPTYLMFFFIVAHTLRSVRDTSGDQMLSKKIANLKNPIVIIIFIALAIFLWQYNLVPFYINSQINKADALVQNKNCSGAFEKMDGILELNSFIKLYSMTEYINFEKVCSELYPENILAYTKKAIELFKEVVKIRPTYTRYWINIGSLTRYLAEQEQDLKIKNELMNQTNYYLDKALQLAPKHQEIWLEKAKTEISAGNYKTAKENSEKCIELNSKTSDCYWYLGLSQIYLKENDEANKNIESAKVKGYNVDAPTSLIELGNAYGNENILDYYNLSIVFDKLLSKNPDNAQYHATLAFVYAKLGQYTKAREEAMIVLKLSPDSKENIEVFLKTLPY